MIRTFVWSAVGSALSIALYALFVATVGVGTGSDAFFAALAVAQTLAGLLFAPYESFAQRFALERLQAGEEPVAPLLGSYLALSGIALVPYYVWGETLLGPLFGRVYAADPALWRHHFRVLGALLPLTGVVAILQVCCQAQERYELPKVGWVLSRLAAIGLLVGAGQAGLRVISVALVVAHFIAAAVSAWGAGSWRPAPGSLGRDLRAALREWFHINRWTVILRTDQLLERVLAAHVKSGFLSIFSLGWSVVMSIVEAFHSSFVVADSNRYYATIGGALPSGMHALLAGAYRRSTAAALRLTVAAAAVSAAAAIPAVTAGWNPGAVNGVGPAEVLLLLVTLVVAQLILFLWKQLAGAYTIEDRAVEFARGLTLVYLAFVGVRIVLTWQWAAVGFCIGLVAYYGTQVAVLARRA